jgi:hypothetical protein
MIKKPTSSAARTTILPHTLQHADSIAGEMHRIALGFIAQQVLPYVKRRAAPSSSEPIPSPPKWLFNVSAGVGKEYGLGENNKTQTTQSKGCAPGMMQHMRLTS